GGVYLLQSFSITVGCAFIGLLNLLYGIIGLRPERRAARATHAGGEPSPVLPLDETSEQQQS
ncbi:MAG TPA: hypothetical protein VH590_02245, partial [Ktedonobacterales bacterium]